MPKQEPIELDIDLTLSQSPTPVVKREPSPIDVDMPSPGRVDEPIEISSDSDADEVDAQMHDGDTQIGEGDTQMDEGEGEPDTQTDEDDAAARDALRPDTAEESELEYEDVRPAYSGADAESGDEGGHAAFGEFPVVEEQESEDEDRDDGLAAFNEFPAVSVESDYEPQEPSKESSRELSMDPAENAKDSPSAEPEVEPKVKTEPRAVTSSSENVSRADSVVKQEKPATGPSKGASPAKQGQSSASRAPSKAPSEASQRDPTPAPGTPGARERTPAGAAHNDREATPRPPATPPSPASSPEPASPDAALAPYVNFCAPRSAQRMPPASQPPPSTKKRAFGALDAPLPPPPSTQPAPRPVARRLFQHVPAPAPVRTSASTASSSTAASAAAGGSAVGGPAAGSSVVRACGSARALTILDDSDAEDGPPLKKRAKTSVSPTKLKRVPAQAPRATPAPPPGQKARRPTKHVDHWHTDGSVVLALRGVAFRLHRSRLAQHSAFFARLFDRKNDGRVVVGEQPGADGEVRAYGDGTMDKLPLYVVEGVVPEDFEKLLDMLDNAVDYFWRPPALPALGALLRAARALSFAALAAFATRTLEALWPAGLPTAPLPHAAHAEETLVLARACSLPTLLKRACYELLRAPALGQSAEQEFLLDGAPAARARTKAAPADLARLVRTREELAGQWARAAALPPDPREFPCPAPALTAPRCAATAAADAVRHWREAVHASELYVEGMHDPVAGLERLCAVDWAARGFCAGCVGAWRASWRRQREKIWENLDLWLELPRKEEGEEGA